MLIQLQTHNRCFIYVDRNGRRINFVLRLKHDFTLVVVQPRLSRCRRAQPFRNAGKIDGDLPSAHIRHRDRNPLPIMYRDDVQPIAIELDGQSYDVAQFHFHAGSEHVIDGEQFPLEMHIVHKTADDQLAVVGLMVEVGAENEALASVFNNIPTEVTEEGEPVDGESVDLAAVLPDSETYFQYGGSLTTPPCSEGVAWQVLDTPIEISQDQLDAFTAVVDGNFRPVQPLGERELVLDSASGS